MPETSNLRSIHFEPKDEPLRDDVRELGALVGEIIRDQGGDSLFERVENARRAAIERRLAEEEGSERAGESSGISAESESAEENGALDGNDIEEVTTTNLDTVAAQIIPEGSELSPGDAELLVRAFLTYFQVVNLAEQIHRIRRRRDYLRQGVAQSGSWLETFRRTKEAGLDLEEVRQHLERLCFEPVFTAHPTEATRRTLLEKELEIAKILVQRLAPDRTPPEERAALAQIRALVTAGWQTDDHAPVAPTVSDERDHVLYHLTDVVYRVVPPLYEDLVESLVEVYGEEARGIELSEVLRCASWVGGDMDGNPNVTAETLRSTLAEHRRRVLGAYVAEVEELAGQLSQTTTRVEVDRAVIDRLEDYERRMPGAAGRFPRRHANMPYRKLLALVAERLRVDSWELGYRDADELAGDLKLVLASLERHRGGRAGAFAIRRMLRRVATFGFHLATLDVRQDSQVHRQALAYLLGDGLWPERSEEERTEGLLARLENDELETLASAAATPNRRDAEGNHVPRADGEGAGQQWEAVAHSTLRVFRAIRDARARGLGSRAIGPYIISMAQGVDDVLAVLALARIAGLAEGVGASARVPLDIAPLLETVPDLQAAPAILDRLWSSPHYRRHLETRGLCQMVMVGYSDSNKDGGLLAARWALHTAQAALVEVAEKHGVELVIFHGRGGTISRGGGKTQRAVLAAPPGSVRGHLRITAQGEVIHARYGLRGIALRTLETTLGAALRASALPPKLDPREERWHGMMRTMARTARTAYRALVYDHPRFYEYFRDATPVDVIEKLLIGSRPASRRSKQGIRNLRAIPWVFAWTQSRHLLPGWYGLGTALEHAVEAYGHEAVGEMAREWSFMGALFEDVEMVLAKADLPIAERYASLAGDVGKELFPRIRSEHARTVRWVLELQGRSDLLDGDPALRRSIALRNPYVDPMSLVQVDLLRRWREGGRQNDELLSALIASVQGIARGLKNTG